MTTAKQRNLFEEIREGLEAYRDRYDTLRRSKLSQDGGQDPALATGAKKTAYRRRLS